MRVGRRAHSRGKVCVHRIQFTVTPRDTAIFTSLIRQGARIVKDTVSLTRACQLEIERKKRNFISY